MAISSIDSVIQHNHRRFPRQGVALPRNDRPGNSTNWNLTEVMRLFREKYEAFLAEFGKGKAMVLSSSADNRVSSRMMSVVCNDGLFYFQTDKNFRKYYQLINNPYVALCTENIQIEGVCTEIGNPMDNTVFCNVYKECFSGSFKKYTLLKNERLFIVTPTFVERWLYIDTVPFIETFHIEAKEYKLSKYEGV